jgi:hypothetical protein
MPSIGIENRIRFLNVEHNKLQRDYRNTEHFFEATEGVIGA